MKARLTGAVLLLALQFPSARYPLPANPSTIEGTLVDADTGKPLAGVTVIPPWPSSWPPPPPDLPLVFPLVQTDADGHFVRDNIFGDDGRASVNFYRTNNDFQFRIFTIAPGQRLTNVVVRIPSAKPLTGLVTGRVIDESGKGAANVEVALYRIAPLRNMFSNNTTRTDDRGEFRLYGLKPDRYIVGYSAGFSLPGFGAAANSIPAVLYPGVGEVSRAEIVTVANDKETRLKDTVIGRVRMGKLRVHIINRGEPAMDGSMGTGDGYNSVHIDAGADFWREYSPMRPGPVSFLVKWTNPGRPDTEYPISIDYDGTERSVEIDLSRVHGLLSIRALIEQADGSTVPFTSNGKTYIHLQSRPGADGAMVSRASSINLPDAYGRERLPLGPDGSAHFTDLITGTYDLDELNLPPSLYLASARQGERDVLADGVNISSQPSTVEIHLRPGAGVFRGKVSDAREQPVQGASVLLIPEPPLAAGHRLGTWLGDVTDQNGHFEIPGIVPGRYRAYAAFGVDMWWSGDHTLTNVDPDFAAAFRDRAIPVVLEENGDVVRDLRLITR